MEPSPCSHLSGLDSKLIIMKEEKDIYEQYLKYSTNKPFLFGKEEHWKVYYEGYEMGYRDVAEESLNSLIKTLGIEVNKFPTNVDEQFDVMKKALQKYYKDKTDSVE